VATERQRARSRDYYARHKEEIAAQKREYYARNRDRCIQYATEYQKEYYPQHKEAVLGHMKEYHALHKEERNAYNREYYACNKEAAADYYQRNKEYFYALGRKKYSENPNVRLTCLMRNGVYYSLRANKGGRHWEDLVGYSYEELERHLESQFQSGMTWDNYGEWVVDHRKPIAAFTFNSAEDKEFQECWALSNLRPLWAEENSHKQAKWSRADELKYNARRRTNGCE